MILTLVVYFNFFHRRIKLLGENEEAPGGCAIQLVGDKCEVLLSLKVTTIPFISLLCIIIGLSRKKPVHSLLRRSNLFRPIYSP